MPDVGDAVTVNVISETIPFPEREWGVPLVIGVSDGQAGVAKQYYSISAVRRDHDRWDWKTNAQGQLVRTVRKGSTPLSRACESLFIQGVKYVWACALPCSDARHITITDLNNVEDKVRGLADAGKIDSIHLAGVTSDQVNLMVALTGIADRNNLIFSVSNKPGRTADQIITDCSNYKSQNCFAVAHADYDFNYFSEHTSLKGEFIGTVGATAPRIASTAEFPVLNDVGEFTLYVHRDGVDDPIPLIQATDFLLYPDEGIIVFDNGMRMTTDTRQLPSDGRFVFQSGDEIYCKYTAVYPYDDVGACALGTILIRKPWHTLFWRYIKCAVNRYFQPEEVPLLEQGDPFEIGTGCVNAIINIAKTNRLSDGLTCGGDPRYIDVTRTQYYMVARIKEGLAGLRLRSTKIPYTPLGLAMIRACLDGVMSDLVRCGALYTYSINLPAFDTIPINDRANRVLKNINISARLAGDIHTFVVALHVTV